MSTTLRSCVRSCRFGAFIITCGLGCSSGQGSSTPQETPAKIQNPRTEADLSTITLSPEAVKRLGIETVVATQDIAASTRTLGGEVVIPEGRTVIVTAPVAGTLIGPTAPLPGARVRKGDPLMAIAPLVPAERDQRIEAQRALTAAEAEELAARQRIQRLEQLLKDGAASVRGVEEARAQHQVTVAAVTAARDRLAGVSRNPVGEQGELIVSAPFDGVVQRVSAVPGQTVAASAGLLEIAHVDTLWVRVSVYAGDASQIDQAQHVSVTRLGDAGTPARGIPVVAPLRGDPAAASVELHYAVAQSQPVLRPGERVLVEVPMKSSTRGLVVPDAAVLYDIHGATWVYEDLGGNAYTRRRVEVAQQAGDRAVVSRGISEGAKVVTTGAPELFGTEFGAGH
jgi:cobalt-zinc-cadmium efflux system membrane fusion protein